MRKKKKFLGFIILIALIVDCLWMSSGTISYATDSLVVGADEVDVENSCVTTLSTGDVVKISIINNRLIIMKNEVESLFSIGNITSTVNQCIVNTTEDLLHIVTLAGVYYCYDLQNGTQLPMYKNALNGEYCLESNANAYVVYVNEILDAEYFCEAISNVSYTEKSNWVTRERYEQLYNLTDPSVGDEIDTEGIITGGNGTSTKVLSNGKIAILEIENSVLKIIVEDVEYSYFDTPSVAMACINATDDLLHILWYTGNYWCMDLHTGNIVGAIYRNSQNGRYCLSRNEYAAMVYGKMIINCSYYYEVLSSKDVIRERFLTRKEFEQLVNDVDISDPSTPVEPSATPAGGSEAIIPSTTVPIESTVPDDSAQPIASQQPIYTEMPTDTPIITEIPETSIPQYSLMPELSPTPEQSLVPLPSEMPTVVPGSSPTLLPVTRVTNSPLVISTTVPMKLPEKTAEVVDEEKQKQMISAKSIKVAYGTDSFVLKAESSGDGELSYESANTKVVKITTDGMVKIQGYGKAKVTITASESNEYEMARKNITISVIPRQIKIKKIASPSKGKIICSWKKDRTVDGYQVQISSGGKALKIRTKKTNMQGVGSSRKPYSIKVRGYKSVGGKKFYGKWSKQAKVKVK